MYLVSAIFLHCRQLNIHFIIELIPFFLVTFYYIFPKCALFPTQLLTRCTNPVAMLQAPDPITMTPLHSGS